MWKEEQSSKVCFKIFPSDSYCSNSKLCGASSPSMGEEGSTELIAQRKVLGKKGKKVDKGIRVQKKQKYEKGKEKENHSDKIFKNEKEKRRELEKRMSMQLFSTLKPSLCCAQLSLTVTLWTVPHQAPFFKGFSRQEYWSVCHAILQGVFLEGSNPHLLHQWTGCLLPSHKGSPKQVQTLPPKSSLTNLPTPLFVLCLIFMDSFAIGEKVKYQRVGHG